MFKVLGTVGLIALVLVGIFGLGIYHFEMYKYFAPKYQNVERQVFENTYSYNAGMIQELQNMQMEYIKASKEHKAALANIILHRVAPFDERKLPDNLREFINQLKRERGLK